MTTRSTKKAGAANGKRANGASSVLVSFRRKFIITTMVFALAVLLAVFGAVSYANYAQRVNDVQNALDFHLNAVANMTAGEPSEAPGPPGGPSGEPFDGQMRSGRSAGSVDHRDRKQLDPQWSDGPIGRRESAGDQVVATATYLIDANGVATSYGDPLGLDDSTFNQVVSAAQSAVEGTDGDYASSRIASLNIYFAIRDEGDGAYALAFASGNYVDSVIMQLIVPFAVAGLIAMVAFFLLSLALSRWSVRPVENAWRSQQQFIADASHELKTPLTVIIANDAILSSMPDEKIGDQKKWIDSTETEAHLMQDLVNDMLYLAQMDGERPQTVGESVNFSDVVESVSLAFDSVAFERGVMLEDDVEPDLIVEGDPARLNRMVGVLVDNACKYADEGGQVTVSLHGEGVTCCLEVRNTGKPIAAEDLEHLFDRFYRADKARTSGKGGFGLGLSIAKSIVEDADGTIGVTSTAEAGTVFTVILPLQS